MKIPLKLSFGIVSLVASYWDTFCILKVLYLENLITDMQNYQQQTNETNTKK
jgi:hypothetical protein